MDFFHTLILALIQGITEFLPISSSAHLVFPSHLLGWPDQGLSFDVAVHFGTLAAVMLYYRQWLLKLGQAFIAAPLEVAGAKPVTIHTSHRKNIHLLRCLMVASLPVFIAGAVLQMVIPEGIRSIQVIAGATIVFAVLLYIADKRKGTKSEYDLLLTTAFIIGLAQVFALIPGTSRSGVTIAAGLLLGMSSTGSANFSFLISIPTILAASVLKTVTLFGSPADVDWMTLAVGAIISGTFAYLTIGWFIKFLNRVGMVPFVIYRIVLGLVLLAVF